MEGKALAPEKLTAQPRQPKVLVSGTAALCSQLGEGPGSLIIWDKSTVGAILKTHHQQERALGQVIKSKAGCIVEGCAGQEALAARLMAAWPLSGK